MTVFNILYICFEKLEVESAYCGSKRQKDLCMRKIGGNASSRSFAKEDEVSLKFLVSQSEPTLWRKSPRIRKDILIRMHE